MEVSMKHIEYIPEGVCSRKLAFDLDDENKIHNLVFLGGCNGNLKAIGKLVENQKADVVEMLLKGNTCGGKVTSCADQFSCAIHDALKK
jgi:uncharacterized protein (TIGR03905 family)